MKNPWQCLPDKPPYVYPGDEALVQGFNDGLDDMDVHFLHIKELLPEAYMGDRYAPVLLLSNNPGFGKRASLRQTPAYAAKMRKNLLHEIVPADYPFVPLDPAFSGPAIEKEMRTGRFWQSKLKELIKEFTEQIVARSVLNVVYFPYASREYKPQKSLLASQEYSFHLVEDAVNRGAVVVLMRTGREKDWLREVPKLNGYDGLFRVKNPRTPAISPKNCCGFAEVVKAIKTSEARRPGP